jgi:nuclear pore complex protein Nup155
VRAMECLRRLLRRSGEALFLLQLICQHNVARLAQTLGNDLRKKLVQLTFHQLVCSEDGDQLAMRLISALMEVIQSPSCSLLCQYESREIASATCTFRILNCSTLGQ